MPNSALLLDKFQRDHARAGADIELGLRPPYLALLNRLGNPHKHLPPVFHVAGTNGKGSTCAFLRAMLEAAGKTVHVYTSPHLVRFHERIRIAGQLIEEEEFCWILEECASLIEPGSLTLFEVTTAAALAAFARHPADFTILEVGLGGRLDATNVIEKPLACLITRLSFDHRDYLGDTIEQIAAEKAGIMRKGVPCFAATQPDAGAMNTLIEKASEVGAFLRMADKDWHVRLNAQGDGFHYEDATQSLNLPLPSLVGEHQIANAGLAIAALQTAQPDPLPLVGRVREGGEQQAHDIHMTGLPMAPLPYPPHEGEGITSVLPVGKDIIAQGLRNAEWPARLQRIGQGSLAQILPKGWELWLDGGHNDSAGEALARQAKRWEERDKLPLTLVCGMIATKRPREFMAPLAPYAQELVAIAIPNEPLSFPAQDIADEASAAGLRNIYLADSLMAALRSCVSRTPATPRRILVCGSLYLAGKVLKTAS
ncbi:MAG: folylpolyglutamate synthase/dihydrofolate synthase family protein [Bdellovibrionales bacterium]